MTRDVVPAPVSERLANVAMLERGIGTALAQAVVAIGEADVTDVSHLQALVREHVAGLGVLGIAPTEHSIAAAQTDGGGRPSEAISSAAREFAAATQAYAELYAAARILCEDEVCDIARRHLADHVEGLRVLARLLPDAIAKELNSEGFFCACICPACGIGACLCVRTSVAMVADVWGWPGLQITDGVELRSPPRPGSQLAAAGIHEGDRLVSVDGNEVHSNAELQAALRAHPLGGLAELSVERPTGNRVVVAVKHVSDWP